MSGSVPSTSNILHCAGLKFLKRSLQHDAIYIMYHMYPDDLIKYHVLLSLYVTSANKLALICKSPEPDPTQCVSNQKCFERINVQ